MWNVISEKMGVLLRFPDNDNLRYQNMRYAMLGQLKKPPAGFEQIVAEHFTAVKAPLLLQCAQWVAECVKPEDKAKMRAVVAELKEELAKLPDAAPVATASTASEPEPAEVS